MPKFPSIELGTDNEAPKATSAVGVPLHMTTPAQEAAIQRAFQEGQHAFREGKSIDDNRYPPSAVEYHQASGNRVWECEDEAINE